VKDYFFLFTQFNKVGIR